LIIVPTLGSCTGDGESVDIKTVHEQVLHFLARMSRYPGPGPTVLTTLRGKSIPRRYKTKHKPYGNRLKPGINQGITGISSFTVKKAAQDLRVLILSETGRKALTWA